MSLLNEGGAIFMYPLLAILFINIGLFIKALMNKDSREKAKSLIISISLFALVWGFLGQVIGLITAFDAIESNPVMASPGIIASGLKISFLTTAFGTTNCLLGIFYIIIIQIVKKD